MKVLQRILKFAGIFLVIAGVVMLVVGYWEKLTASCPCHKEQSDGDYDDEWEREAMDYADLD